MPTLGQCKCLSTEGVYGHELGPDNPEVSGEANFTLKTQGIFSWPHSGCQRIPNKGVEGCPGGVIYVWGLARDNQWLLAKVDFKGEWGYKERGYERAEAVEIERSDIRSIVAKTKTTPKKIWEELGRAVKEWAERRGALYETAFHFANEVKKEEELISFIYSKKEEE